MKVHTIVVLDGAVGHVFARRTPEAVENDLHEFVKDNWPEDEAIPGDRENAIATFFTYWHPDRMSYIREEVDLDGGMEEETVNKDFLIHAKAWSDDRCIEVEFDATRWFEQATEEQIIALAKTDPYGHNGEISNVLLWGYDYSADEVAQYMSNYNGELARLFQYSEMRATSRFPDIGGFDCEVDAVDARRWLAEHRPEIELPTDEDVD